MFKIFSIIPFIMFFAIFFIAISMIIYDIHLTKNRKINKINTSMILKNKKFLDIYKEIASGYKVKYKEVKLPIFSIIIIIISIALIIFFITEELFFMIPIFMFLPLPIIIIASIFKYHKEIKLNSNNGNKCEYHLIEKLGKSFYSDFKELNRVSMLPYSKVVYRESTLCNTCYDDFYLKECYNFYLNSNVKVEMYNIHTEDESEDSEGNETTYTVFGGILTKITLDFNIDGYIKITRDSLIKLGENNVQLDSTEFEKKFDVRASDKIKAMQLLTSEFMTNLNDLLNKYDIYFEIYISNNIMYITFDEYILNNENPLRKPNLKETYTKYCKLEHLINIINFFYNRLKEMN